jgi:predicted transcriptional regulator
MAGEASATVVLLPIKPTYARLIMDGTKRVEFRKTPFARKPTHVLVYASSPTMRLLGYFEVGDVVVDCVDALWTKYAEVGGVAEDDFREYYGGRERGVALGIGRVHAFADPLPLAALGLTTPPQSFMYIQPRLLSALQETP